MNSTPLRTHGAAVLACILTCVTSSLAQTAVVTTPPIGAPSTTIEAAVSDSGPPSPRVVITDPAWDPATVSVATTPRGSHPARLINLSILGRVSGKTDVLIAGASVDGPDDLPLLARAIGPGLEPFPNLRPLAYPVLAMHRGPSQLAETNTFAPNATTVGNYVGAFPARAPTEGNADGDAAIVGRPGAGVITAVCTSDSAVPGDAMIEFYDSDAGAAAGSAHFVNFSARGRVPADGVLIIGFVVAGEGSVRLLLRGIGSSLTPFGVAETLADPQIALFRGPDRVASNLNWREDNAAEILTAGAEASTFPITSDLEAAMVVTLTAGTYSLHVRGAAGQTGVALGEIYELPPATSFDAADATNALGLALFRQVSPATSAPNLMLSPYSLSSAFALAYAGAAGGNRVEMAEVLHFPEADATLVAGFKALREGIAGAVADSVTTANARSTSGRTYHPVEWSVANRLFGQADTPFHAAYLELLRSGFDAPLQPVDFKANPEAVRLLINAWVEDATRNKIIELIPRGVLNELSRFTLVNALYLKAPWDAPFRKDFTSDQPFQLADGTSVTVPTMRGTGPTRYQEESGLTVVALDSIGNGLQLLILLPKAGESPEALAARLTPADFVRWGQLTVSAQSISLWLPKFKIAAATLELSDALQALGMRAAFDIPSGSANFEGIAPREGGAAFALQSVCHKTFVAIDEDGLEAAAATGIAGGVTSIPSGADVRIDRPFLCAVQHRATGACLFLGRIGDPR